jgi:tetratricopeptide (TPR) repeat protein
MRLVVVLFALVSLISCSRDPNVVKQRYLENGNKYFERGKYKEATIMYRNALQKDRRFGQAYYQLALAELKLSRVGPAVAALKRAAELLPTTSKDHWDALVRLTEIYILASVQNQDKGMMDEIDTTVRQLLQRDPNSFDGLRLQGDVLYSRAGRRIQEKQKEGAQELLKGALASYRKADSVKPGNVPVILQMARVEGTLENPAESERLFRMAIKADKTIQQSYIELYRLFLVTKKPLEGEQVLKDAIAANPKQYGFLTLLATHYYGMQRRDDMLRVITQIKSHAKDFDEAFLTVGDLYVRIGEWDEAVRQYREGMAVDSKKKAVYQKRIIEVLMKNGKPQEASEVASAILKDNPNDADARGLQASFLLDKGDVAKAVTELQSVVTRSPENPISRFQLGRAHAARGEWEQARQQFLKAIDLRPDYIMARLALAQLQLSRGEFDATLKTVQGIQERDKQNPHARLIESAALMGLKKYSESRALLGEMSAKYPSSPDVQFQAGLINLAEARYKEAESAFRKSYELNPAITRGLMGLVETEMAQNRPEAALRLLQAEADKAPNRMDLRVALGNVAVRSGRYDAAIADYQKALSLIDKNSRPASEIFLRIGETYRRKGDLGGSVTYLQKARDIDPGSSIIMSTLGLALDAAGRRQEAKQVYEATLKSDPGNPVILNNLAFLLAESGSDLDQALTLAQRAKQKLPNVAEVSDTLGWIYLKKNLSDNAIDIFKDLVAKQPHNSTYRYHLGMALSQKGDKRQALKELQEALKSDPAKEERDKIQALITKLG